MGVLAMFSEGFFDLMAVAVVADLLGLTTIRAVIIAVDAALCIGLLRDAVAGAGNVALADFNDSLPSGVCQRVVSDSPRCLTAGAPPKPMHACPGAVHSAAGGPSEVCKALPGLPELHGTGGGVSPGGVLGQIPSAGQQNLRLDRKMTLPGWSLRTGTDSSQKAVALSVSIC